MLYFFLTILPTIFPPFPEPSLSRELELFLPLTLGIVYLDTVTALPLGYVIFNARTSSVLHRLVHFPSSWGFFPQA